MNAKHTEYTNGEITATIAPIFGKQPDEIMHCVLIIITDEMTAGLITTECRQHTHQIFLDGLSALNTLGDEYFNDPNTH